MDSNRPRGGIPAGLDELKPSPRLGAILSTIDVDRLSGREAVIFARAQNRQIAHDQARAYRALSRVADVYTAESRDADLYEFASAEIGAALSLTRRTADREMGIAMDLTRYPELLESLEQGIIDVPRARTIIRGISHVDQEIGIEAIHRVLPHAPDLTTGQLAARLRRIVVEADPEQATESYKSGVDERRIWSELDFDGTGTMIATGLEANEMSAASRNINGIARKLKNEGDPRTIDQLRADVFVGLLQGSASGTGAKGQVELRVDLTTLAELDDKPGELAGLGVVVADVARQVARKQRDSVWTYTVIDEATGETFFGTTSRRPTVEQQRMIRARYPTCVFKGCRMPAVECDIDHTEDWAQGGPTTLCNLAPLCRYHHRLKHLTAWSYHLLGDGSIHWISQFGLTYVTHPP